MEVQENTVTSNEAVEGQEDQQSTQDTVETDYESLYKQEVSNAKKLRKRAQEAETLVGKFNSQKEKAKADSLKEQKQFKELSEELERKVEELSPFKD